MSKVHTRRILLGAAAATLQHATSVSSRSRCDKRRKAVMPIVLPYALRGFAGSAPMLDASPGGTASRRASSYAKKNAAGQRGGWNSARPDLSPQAAPAARSRDEVRTSDPTVPG